MQYTSISDVMMEAWLSWLSTRLVIEKLQNLGSTSDAVALQCCVLEKRH